MKTEDQQIASLKPEHAEISDIGVQSLINSDLKVDNPDNNQIEKLEKEEDQSVKEDDHADEDVTVLAFWFGNPKLDVLTAEEWIESVQRAKVLSEWNDLETMHKVVNALFGEALDWFLNLVTSLDKRLTCFNPFVQSLILIL